MCGIIGIASVERVLDCTWLAAGRDTMAHRGPDDAGEWWSENGCVGLGHRRLSVIDLTSLGHQPMHHEEGSLSIVFNGEIYNFLELRSQLEKKGHHFVSHTDTEIILISYLEWGKDCLSHLNGMFAFAIYDSRQRILFVARDRAGEKPLFYALNKGMLRFSSELKALMADPAFERRIDDDALDCYLTLGFVPGERCMLKGVNKLPPAHAMEFNLVSSDFCVWRYWRIPDFDTAIGNGFIDESLLLDELESLLEDSVRRQLVADVPVGVLLSGGVDSSLVTAMAVRSSSSVRTFTISFSGHGRYDESEHARLIADHFGTEHVELDAGDSSVDMLPMLARQLDEPMADSSIIPTYLVSNLIKQHCTVALGGDGGDELFGGYQHYSRLLWMQEKLYLIPGFLRSVFSNMAEQLLPVGLKGRHWIQGMGVDLSRDIPLLAMNCFDKKYRAKLMADSVGWHPCAEQIRRGRMPEVGDLLQRVTRMDFENYLPEDILVKVDRASMLNSLEVRAPFLDQHLIEFAYGRVPAYMKATSTSRKGLLKKLTARVLPSEFDQHRKQGFTIPLDAWLQSGPWQRYFQEILLDSGSSFFNKDAVASLLKGQLKGRMNSERLFSLVLFEVWRREYNV